MTLNQERVNPLPQPMMAKMTVDLMLDKDQLRHIHLKIWFSNIDGLVEERRNSFANALELRHSYTNPLL